MEILYHGDENLRRRIRPALATCDEIFGRRIGRRRNRGCNSMVEYLPSKQATWVRFPSPAFTWGGQRGEGKFSGTGCIAMTTGGIDYGAANTSGVSRVRWSGT